MPHTRRGVRVPPRNGHADTGRFPPGSCRAARPWAPTFLAPLSPPATVTSEGNKRLNAHTRGNSSEDRRNKEEIECRVQRHLFESPADWPAALYNVHRKKEPTEKVGVVKSL